MGFPLPALFAWAAALSESLGGLLLAVGLLTRPAAFFILVTMFVAAFIRQAGDPFLERELALLYGAVAIQFLLVGSGRFGLDAFFRSRALPLSRTYRPETVPEHRVPPRVGNSLR
jgi:putative oxidoreductase